MLEITGLRKGYPGLPVLRGVDLRVDAGQVLGLLGANGAGKTTLIGVAAGLVRPDGGTVTVAGLDVVRQGRQVRRTVGLAPQRLGIYPTLTLRANLECFAGLSGLPGRRGRARAAEVAEAFGLADRLGDRAGTLSGGQQRRLHTALALLHRPTLLFLDEPTVGADVVSRAGILAAVRQLAAEGSAVVYTTHHLTELDQLEADVAVLHEGRIVVRGTRREVLARYATASVVLDFDGPAPALPGWRPDGEGRLVPDRAPSDPPVDPAAAAASALAELAGRAERLRGVELAPASLESAYLTITGQSLTPSRRPSEELHVLAS